MLGRRLIVSSLLLSVAIPAARADDTWIDASGGTALSLSGHPTIRMVAEQVHIRLPQGVVHARFVFKNEGPKTSVVMGFPEDGNPDPLKHPSYLFGFKSSVDGRPVRVRRLHQKPDPDDTGVGCYRSFWVKRVSFAAGQTRSVTVRYRTNPGYDTVGNSLFNYILTTGRAWKGPIGNAEILLDVSGLRDGEPSTFAPGGYRRNAGRVAWRFHHLEPNEDGRDDISVTWFTGVRVNGTSVNEQISPYRVHPLVGESFRAVRCGGQIFISPRAATDWLGAHLTVRDHRKTVRISEGNAYAKFKLGQIMVGTRHGPVRLRARVVRHWGSMMLPLRPLIEALGGSVHYHSAGSVDVTI